MITLAKMTKIFNYSDDIYFDSFVILIWYSWLKKCQLFG